MEQINNILTAVSNFVWGWPMALILLSTGVILTLRTIFIQIRGFVHGVGIAPMNRDSGTYRGKRMTGGGRQSVRARLYMPTVVACHHNPVLQPFYQRLWRKGKTKMTALVAATRKLLTIVNTMLAKREDWKPQFS